MQVSRFTSLEALVLCPPAACGSSRCHRKLPNFSTPSIMQLDSARVYGPGTLDQFFSGYSRANIECWWSRQETRTETRPRLISRIRRTM
ncbi:hypothetical protein F4679DRAFT_522420 [Xylaria curta]|nr:hypothetical protein F4679DRAFT_522420 [Xylaria curta]